MIFKKKQQAPVTAFELQSKLLTEFYSLAAMTLDTADFVNEKINNKIQNDNYKIFKKTRKVLWRKHRGKKDFFAVANKLQVEEKKL